MTTVFVVADPHVGNHKMFGGPLVAGINGRCAMVLETLRQVGKQACQHTVETGDEAVVAVAGDLFDVASPSPQVLSAMQRVIVDSGVRWVLIKGNHDSMSDAPGDHALGPLAPVVDTVIVADEPSVVSLDDLDLLCVPFQPGPGDEWLPKAVDRLARMSGKRRRVLVFHLGVRDAETAVYLRDAPDSVSIDVVRSLQAEHRIAVAMAGNWHDHRRWSGAKDEPVETVQVGTLAPTGWDNPGMKGRGLTAAVSFDGTDFALRLYTVPGPRFLSVSGDLARKRPALEKARARGHTVYVERAAAEDEMGAVRAQLEAWQAEGLISGWRAPPVDKDADRVAARAVEAARSAETVEDALSAFVGGMRLREGVERAEVLARSREYLTRKVGA